MDRDGTLLALGTAAALAAAATLRRRGGSPARVFPFLSKRVPVRYNPPTPATGLAWSAPAALLPLLADVPPVTQNTFLRWARGMDPFDPQPVLVRAGDRFLGIFEASATATPGWTLIGQVLFEGVEHRGLLDLERVHPAGMVGAPARLVLKLPDSVLAMPRISDTPRGSRGELVSLAQRRTRKDEPRFQVYTVVAEPDSDWMIEAGFADIEVARRHRDEVLKDWSRKLKIVDRKALAFHGEDPREARHWMQGAPMRVPPGTPLSPLDAAKVAIHNAYWWTWGRPFPHMDEAVVDPAEHEAAREWAPKAAVVIFREYGLPDDFGWWESVDAELERIGARLYNESINAAVYALYPDPVPARPTRLRPRGSGARTPPPVPASMGMRHTSTFSFRIKDQGWVGRGPADLARVLDSGRQWLWGTYIVAGNEDAMGLWIDAQFRPGEVYGKVMLATREPLAVRRGRSLVRGRLHRRIRDGFGGGYDTADPTDWTPPLFTDDMDVFPRIASVPPGSRASRQGPLRESCYVSGYCAEFAVALHRRYGWPLGAFYQVEGKGEDRNEILVHAFAIPPGRGKVADVAGIRTKAEVRSLLLIGPGAPIAERKVTEKDLDDMGAEGLLPEVLADAEAFVAAHPERWR